MSKVQTVKHDDGRDAEKETTYTYTTEYQRWIQGDTFLSL